jgi:branched-chain amino acid transport system substrate-binding protein
MKWIVKGSLVLAAQLTVAGMPARAEDAAPLDVAIVIPQSGPSLPITDPAIKSIKIALDEVNAKGFSVGGKLYKFNAHWFDEECKPQTAINATRAALAQVKDGPIVWTPMCSSSALAVRPLLEATKEEFDWRSRDLAQYLAAHGMKTGAIVAVNSDWGSEAGKVFAKHAGSNGIKITQTLSFDEQTEEFVPLLSQVRQAKPDFIFMASQLINEQVGFLRAYKQLGLKIQLVGESTWTEDVADKAGWPLIDGMLTAGAWVPSDHRAAVQDYIKKYKAAFGTPPAFNGPPAYDMVYMTVAALQKAGSLDPEAIRSAMRTMTFTGLVYGNGTLKFDENGQAEFPVTITVFDAKTKTRIVAPAQ